MSDNSGRTSSVVVGVGAALAVAALVVAGYVIGFNRSDGGGGPGGGASTTTSAPQEGAGQQAFVDKCGSCHALSAAATTGNIGPDLDQLKPPAPVVLAQIKSGGGAMPAGLSTGKEAQQIAEYVAKATGG